MSENTTSDWKKIESIPINDTTELVVSTFKDNKGVTKIYINQFWKAKDGRTGRTKGTSVPPQLVEPLISALIKAKGGA